MTTNNTDSLRRHGVSNQAATNSNNSNHSNRKKWYKRVYWNRVFIALLSLFVIVIGVTKCLKVLTHDKDIPPTSAASSETASEDSSVTVDKPEAPKQMVIQLTDDELVMLTLAVQHECGISPDIYYTTEERDLVLFLRNKEYLGSITEKELENLRALESISVRRLNQAQQLTTAAIVNRIGVTGFASSLYEVLDQENQFKCDYSYWDESTQSYINVHESLLEDIESYWNNPNRIQFDPCDTRTISNIKSVLGGESGIPKNLYYEISALRGDPQEAISNQISKSPYVKVWTSIPCIDSNTDRMLVFGINENNSGYAYPLAE